MECLSSKPERFIRLALWIAVCGIVGSGHPLQRGALGNEQPGVTSPSDILLDGAEPELIPGDEAELPPMVDMSGCWEGTWHGCTDGFTGTVNARIRRCGPNRYHAEFWGICFKVVPYRYESTLIACNDPETGLVHFKVTQKLPLWGCYWVKGHCSQCKFFARYNTDDHVGYFVMRRVCCCCQ
jgi:hypothetical protein